MLARESVSAFRAKPTMQGKGAGVLCLQMTPSGYDIVVLSLSAHRWPKIASSTVVKKGVPL